MAVLLTCALVSGLFELLFGVPHAWGGTPEAAAAVVYGCWILACLVLTPPGTPDPTLYGVAFWLALAMHVTIGELWSRRTPR